MTPRETSFLFALGLPLLASIVFVAFRRGFFARDRFATPLHRAAAAALLFVVLTAVVLLPAASAGEAPTSAFRFSQLFVLQGFLAAFLFGWWFLTGRPSLPEFLALRSKRPFAEAGAGVLLGMAGWLLTVMLGLAVAVLLGRLGRTPNALPSLVRFLVSLSFAKRALVVLVAMVVEELVFRAFLQRRFGPWAASILFLLAHGGYGSPWFFVGLVAITTVLAVTFEKTRSVVAPAFAHGTFDAIQLLIVLPAAVKLMEKGLG